MLHFQGDGFVVFYKRLEKGTYELPLQNSGFISNEQLLFLLQGLVLKSVRKHSRYSHANHLQ
jgi:transposase